MVSGVLIPIILPLNARRGMFRTSRVQVAPLKEANVSVPRPTPSATENTAPTRMLLLPCSTVVSQRLLYRQGCSSVLPRAPTMTPMKSMFSYRRPPVLTLTIF